MCTPLSACLETVQGADHAPDVRQWSPSQRTREVHAGVSRSTSESGMVSEDGDEFLDGKTCVGLQNGGPVSTTSEEAHSETGQKTRGGKSQRFLQSLTSKTPECVAQGQPHAVGKRLKRGF